MTIIKSTVKTFEILECLNTFPYEKSCKEIAQEIQMPISTVHRFLSTMENIGYVFQNPKNLKYKLGKKLLDLNTNIISECIVDLKDVCFKYMKYLAEDTRETVSLAVLDGTEIVRISSIKSKENFNISFANYRMPAMITAIGKYMLAWLPEKELKKSLPKKLEKRTPKTIDNYNDLAKDFTDIRKLNYALDNEESHLWVRSVASGIWNNKNTNIAAISIVAPVNRLTDDKINDYSKKIIKIAGDISNSISNIENTDLLIQKFKN